MLFWKQLDGALRRHAIIVQLYKVRVVLAVVGLCLRVVRRVVSQSLFMGWHSSGLRDRRDRVVGRRVGYMNRDSNALSRHPQLFLHRLLPCSPLPDRGLPWGRAFHSAPLVWPELVKASAVGRRRTSGADVWVKRCVGSEGLEYSKYVSYTYVQQETW